jgi:hypothetical protein
MSIATYRGVKYDTKAPKQEYVQWWNEIYDDSSRRLTYRGTDYSPAHTNKKS